MAGAGPVRGPQLSAHVALHGGHPYLPEPGQRPSWRHQLTSANGQPAVAFYLGADASGPHDAWSITALTLRGNRIAEITSFLGPDHFTPFGLPPR